MAKQGLSEAAIKKIMAAWSEDNKNVVKNRTPKSARKSAPKKSK